MESSDVCKIKIVLKKCQLACVTVFLKEFSTDHRRRRRREATISISSRQTAVVLKITPQQLRHLLIKIERGEIDGVIGLNDWLAIDVASDEMKLLKYECGAHFLLEYRNCRVKIDQEIINALIYADQRIHSFVAGFVTAAQ